MTPDENFCRTIIFVRHGQYREKPERLSTLGRIQAKYTAETLKSLKVTKIYSSTMPRAVEMALLIGAKLHLQPCKKRFFSEGLLPGTIAYEVLIKGKHSHRKKTKIEKRMKNARITADKAFNFLFRNPRKESTCEIVVAHGNVIRLWVCKALKIDERKWSKISVPNASLTTFKIDKKGNVVLTGLSDCGHLPYPVRTFE